MSAGKIDFASIPTDQLQETLAHAKRILAIEEARKSLIAFARLMMPDPEHPDDTDKSLYQVSPHHEMIAEMLERLESGKTLRIALSIPPQHGKSLLFSIMFLAWYRGRNPHKHVIFATYSDTFAEEFGGEVRNLMQSDSYKQVFPNIHLRTGSKAKDSLIVEQGGRMSFIGRGGAATGKPAHLVVIDDPLKNAEEANSPTIIKQLHEWYRKVIYSRVRSTTAIGVVHTRWTEDDLIGRLCDPEHSDRKNDQGESKSWTYINVPAVLKAGPVADALKVKLEMPTDPRVIAAFGRAQVGVDGKMGEPQPVPMAALWSEEFSLEHLASAYHLGPSDFNALYMGRPTPETGDYFKAHWLVAHRNPDEYPSTERLRFYAASDHALTTKTQNDATCMGAIGVDQNNHLWVMPELVWDRFETDRLVEEMIAIMKFRKPQLWWAESEHIEKAIGPFRRQEQLKHGAFTTVVPVPSLKDLHARARNIQGRMSLRSVHFPAWMPWWPEARAQLLKFPSAKHDDFVSFLSLIGRGLDSMAPAERPKGADKVIRVGSMAWVKAQHDRQQRRMKMQKSAAGF
jgi:predicted phage terminase large subunit-like protein